MGNTEKDLLEIKKEIIDAGLELLEKGLIVRTWGNISCRVDKKHFLITPSGIKYEDLTPEKIVLVNIHNSLCSISFVISHVYREGNVWLIGLPP